MSHSFVVLMGGRFRGYLQSEVWSNISEQLGDKTCNKLCCVAFYNEMGIISHWYVSAFCFNFIFLHCMNGFGGFSVCWKNYVGHVVHGQHGFCSSSWKMIGFIEIPFSCAVFCGFFFFARGGQVVNKLLMPPEQPEGWDQQHGNSDKANYVM